MSSEARPAQAPSSHERGREKRSPQLAEALTAQTQNSGEIMKPLCRRQLASPRIEIERVLATTKRVIMRKREASDEHRW
jgi:hypothetical protein